MGSHRALLALRTGDHPPVGALTLTPRSPEGLEGSRSRSTYGPCPGDKRSTWYGTDTPVDRTRTDHIECYVSVRPTALSTRPDWDSSGTDVPETEW